jgi:hypothetical protein
MTKQDARRQLWAATFAATFVDRTVREHELQRRAGDSPERYYALNEHAEAHRSEFAEVAAAVADAAVAAVFECEDERLAQDFAAFLGDD